MLPGCIVASVSTSRFRDLYGTEPSVSVRSPGRVNLIGEHTDYSLLPVMPLAIDRAIHIEAGAGRLVEAHSLSETDAISYPPDAPPRVEGWHRYLVAAVSVLGRTDLGVRLLVDGDLPSTGGLSSSSAFTVGVIAALDRLWQLGLGSQRYPDLAIAAERSLGVEGGAMDQTVISLARAGAALRIDFDPLRTRVVPIPEHVKMVAAYSGTAAPKGGSANRAYNTRVVAARAAALLLGREVEVDLGSTPTLSRVVESGPDLIENLPEVSSASEIADALAVDPLLMTGLTVGTFPADAPLPVRAVASHVLSEARRVDEAEAALVAGDLDGLGSLLDRSHASLVGFGASSVRLDALVAAMRDAGARGARLTGAGFGGYAIAVCSEDRQADVLAAAEGATGGPAFPVVASDGVG